jgi:glycosyltransferase involved in cell wall biosynthesis
MLLSVVVPVKDEQENVRPLYERVRGALDGSRTGPWELIFVDDGSTDGTFAQLEKLAAADERVKIVRLRRNFGQSAATQAGLDTACGEIIVTMDGDLQNDPADIPLLIAKLHEGYDAVLGQRHKRQDKLLLRKLPSLMANAIIRQVLGVPFKDLAAPCVRFVAKCLRGWCSTARCTASSRLSSCSKGRMSRKFRCGTIRGRLGNRSTT